MTGKDNKTADAIGFEMPEKNTLDFTLVQPSLHVSKGSKSSHLATQGEDRNQGTQGTRIIDSMPKTLVLTGKQGSDMMSNLKVPVAQLDRVLASEAKG